MEDENNETILDTQLYGWIDSLWIHILDAIEKVITNGYGSVHLGSQDMKIIMETYKKTSIKFFITRNNGSVLQESIMSSQKAFFYDLITGANHFFNRLKEHLQLKKYDNEINKTNVLLEKLQHFHPIEKYFSYPDESKKINHILFEHDQEWQAMFTSERDFLLSIITESDVDIQHIGSTAIKGLYSRPMIDIVIGTKSSWSSEMVINDLIRDYFRNESLLLGINYRYCLKKGTPPTCHYNVYVTERNSSFWNRVITFRDQLLADQTITQQYDKLKKNASSHGDLDDYEKQKRSFINSVLLIEKG